MSAEVQDKALVEREVELLRLLSQGFDICGAARSMGVSDRTVRRTARDLEQKLAARTLFQAIYLATKRGLI